MRPDHCPTARETPIPVDVKAIGTTAAEQPLAVLNTPRHDLQLDDVHFRILYCGICHSDLHQVKTDFGLSAFPMVPGHEIVGRVTAVGRSMTRFKVGDLAAIGCIVHSCGQCPSCARDLQQFCTGDRVLPCPSTRPIGIWVA